MGLPDAAAEFARQLVVALAGDTGNLEWERNAAVAERDALRGRLHVVKTQLDSYMDVWRRIEKLVGREFTSPESVIDRVAYLIDCEATGSRVADEVKLGAEKQRLLIEQRDETARELAKAMRQRDELLRAARELPLAEGRYLTGLRLAVERVESEIDSP